MATRTRIPEETSADLLFYSDHTCCVCREPGKQVQIHHIDEDPANHAIANLAVLCLSCHDRTQTRGGFGRHLRGEEVERYRSDWLERVQKRRDRADEIAVRRQTTSTPSSPPATDRREESLIPPKSQTITAYVFELPGLLSQAYARAKPKFSGSTAEMIGGCQEVIDVVSQMWVNLASWFPEHHFGGVPAPRYLSEYVAARFEWWRGLSEPLGFGTGGSIVGPEVGAAVLSDVEQAVAQTVSALLEHEDDFSFLEWSRQWSAARPRTLGM